MKEKNLMIRETLTLAVKKHQENKLMEAVDLYEKILKSQPNHIDANYNIAKAFYELRNIKKQLVTIKKP